MCTEFKLAEYINRPINFAEFEGSCPILIWPIVYLMRLHNLTPCKRGKINALFVYKGLERLV